MSLIQKMDPQPPKGVQISYMLGDESWLPKEERSPRRMICEQWGNLGPMVLNAEIPKNSAGFRVLLTEIQAPEGCRNYQHQDGVYYWTDEGPE